MMKSLSMFSLVVVVAFAGSLSAKEALESGPAEGDRIGAFYVTKIAGAESDGVDQGQNVCYRCKNGKRPQVIIFTRSTSPKLIELVQKLDQAVDQNEDAQLCAFVNLLGESIEDLSEQAKDFAAKAKTSNIPFVVPDKYENGPDNYGINAKAAVTVVMANESKVRTSYAVSDAEQLDVAAVISRLSEILN